MNNEKTLYTHYLTLSYKSLISYRIVHYILFFIEIYILLAQILEIYYNDFISFKSKDLKMFSPSIFLLDKLSKLSNFINLSIYFIIIIFIMINNCLLNTIKFKENIFIKIMINLTELFFYRLFSLLIFNYFFLLIDLYYFIIILVFLYIFVLIFNLYKNHLFLFFPSLINYPYDVFSMIIDLHLLGIKIFISISSMISNKEISQFCFAISVSIIFVLLIYLSYIMRNKSYYIMNNMKLNVMKFSIILSFCINIIIMFIIDKKDLFTVYYGLCYFNIIILCTLFIYCLYDPYQYIKFDQDNNKENVFYYFFILDRDKNKNFLLEEKIEEHVNKCNKCNLCKKYIECKYQRKDEEIDLYYIIFNGKDCILNLMNNIVRGIKKNGKCGFLNNSYFLINLTYIYHLGILLKNHNYIINTELLYEIINSENKQFLEDFKISLEQIKYTNKFLIKAKQIISSFYSIFKEKNLEKKIKKILILSEELNELKDKEIKYNSNHVNNSGNNIEGLPNCNNSLTICSLFYEELFNESISNSGNYIRESPNILEDLINNNYKNSKQITLEVNIEDFKIIIIRAGGYLNKYENYSIEEIFPLIFKNKQIIEIKNLLLNSNKNIKKDSKKNSKTRKKKKENRKQYINFNFIIEEKENNEKFYRILKLKLILLFAPNIHLKIYLNGTYIIDSDIVVTEKNKDKEIVLYYGNKFQISTNKNKDDKTIKTFNNIKYMGNNKLTKNYINFIDNEKFEIYHLQLNLKANNNIIKSNNKKNASKIRYSEAEEEKINIYEENNDLIIFNDKTSQGSSTKSSITRNNNFVYYNRGNKKFKRNENFSNILFHTKYILLITIFLLFIFMIFQCFYFKQIYIKLYQRNYFFLLFKNYISNFNILFFSILSKICIAESKEKYHCINKMEEKFKTLELVYSYDTDNYYTLINFSNLLSVQNSILTQNLEIILSNITKYLSEINDNEINNFMIKNVSHFKINQIMKNNIINLYLSKENITLTEFILLMTSRFGIILKNNNDNNSPIYILNKTGDEALNNIYLQGRLNTFQENIYLLILDYQKFTDNIDIISNEVGKNSFNLRQKFRKVVYTFNIINFLLMIFIIIILFVYIIIYFIIVFKLLKDIYINLKKKNGNIEVKEILTKKIDNLKLLLTFYENDINKTIKNLNTIYNEYLENYNLKMKEESRIFKKEVKNKTEDISKKLDCSKLIKVFNNYKFFKYSKRNQMYRYSLLFIIILILFGFILTLVIWLSLFEKEDTAHVWIDANEGLYSVTNKLMNNLLLMFYNNQTLDDFSKNVESNNYIYYIFSKLYNFYDSDKFFDSISSFLVLNHQKIDFNCSLFYEKLDNSFYEKLKKEFVNEKEELYHTMVYFCEWVFLMKFHNYKSLYLQLFTWVKQIMENFDNKEYENFLVEFDRSLTFITTFLFNYFYLMDILFINIQEICIGLVKEIKKNEIINNLVFLLLLILLIVVIFFIYLRNVQKDCKKFLQVKNVFKVCSAN